MNQKMKRKPFFILVLLAALLISPYYGCKPTATQTQKEEEKKEEQGGDHSKAVRPDPSKDKKWTKRTIDDGIIYWEFNGFEPDASGAYQDIHVADIDMSKGCKLNMFYGDDGQRVASWVQSNKNAIVTINGGYETSSIYIKCNGVVKSEIPNNKINGTDIPNWKDDGGIRFTANGRTIEFINSLCSDTEGQSQYGAALDAQRSLYKSADMKSWSNVMSSGPLLVYDYKPFGETFVNVSPTVYNDLPSEDPQHHQGVRHPRTAIAMTGQGSLLLIAVDGRSSGKREGFSAKELTKFLVKNFDVKYALNLDGGGSTTMCVSGCGDATTNVVNHPSDSAGERTVRTFFYITK